MNLKGKRIVITGATSGLGLEVLKMLLNDEEVRILAVGRNISEIPQDDKVFPLQCDVSSEEGVEEIFAAATEKMGGVDLFWANAGYGCYERFGEPDWKKMEQIFHTNVLSPFYSLQKMLRLYPQEKIHFVVTDSIVGQLEVPGYALYAATKFAINGGMSAIQYEIPKNVTLSVIYPVATRTRFFERAGTTIQKSGPVQSSEACARAILRGIKRDKKKIYPYAVWPVLNFSLTIFPFLKQITLSIFSKALLKTSGK